MALKEYGLSNKEIEVYLIILQLGESNLQKISGRTDYPKTTVYNTLRYLIRKGLVSSYLKEKITHYQASDPKKISEDVDRKKRLLDEVIPDLINLRKNVIEPSNIEMFEGLKGLHSIYMDIYREKQQIYFFGRGTHQIEELLHIPANARIIRLERKIPAKIIIEPNSNRLFETKAYKKITKIRFLPLLKEFPCMIYIYGKKVGILSIRKETVGFIIQNEQVAQTMKLIFDILWNQAKE